jgi:hypothetical protein
MAKVDLTSPGGNMTMFSQIASNGTGNPLPYSGDITKYGYGPQHDWFGSGSSGGGLPGPSPMPMPMPGPGPSLGQPGASGGLSDNSGKGTQGGENPLSGGDGGSIGDGGLSTPGAEGISDAQKLKDGAVDPRQQFESLLEKAMTSLNVGQWSTTPVSLGKSFPAEKMLNLNPKNLASGALSYVGGIPAALALKGINVGAEWSFNDYLDTMYGLDPEVGMAMEKAKGLYTKDPTAAKALMDAAWAKSNLKEFTRNALMDLDYAPAIDAGDPGYDPSGMYGTDPDYAANPATTPGVEVSGGFTWDAPSRPGGYTKAGNSQEDFTSIEDFWNAEAAGISSADYYSGRGSNGGGGGGGSWDDWNAAGGADRDGNRTDRSTDAGDRQANDDWGDDPDHW